MNNKLISPNFILIIAILFTIADLIAAFGYLGLSLVYPIFYISIGGSIFLVYMLWQTYFKLKKNNYKSAINKMAIAASTTTILFIFDWVASYFTIGSSVVDAKIIISTILTDVIIAGLFWIIVIIMKKEEKK